MASTEESVERTDVVSRRAYRLLVAPLIGLTVLALIGTAFAAPLAVDYPLLLVALSPRGPHLFLAAAASDMMSFYLVATVRLYLPDPFLWGLGRLYGPDAMMWLELRAGMAGRSARWIEKLFRRAGHLVLFVSPGLTASTLAGVTRMRFVVFTVINVLGSLVYVSIVWVFGDIFSEFINSVRDLIGRYMLPITLVSMLGVGATMTYWRRRLAAASEPLEPTKPS